MDPQPHNPLLKETLDQVHLILGSRLAPLQLERAAVGLHFSGVKLSNGAGGIAFTPLGEVWRESSRRACAKGLPRAGNLAGKPVTRCLDDLYSGEAVCRALAAAALSALTRCCCEAAHDIAPQTHIGVGCFDDPLFPAGGHTVIIGRGAPIPRAVLHKADSLTVLHASADDLCEEQRPYFAPLDQAESCLPGADLVIITGHTLCDASLVDYLRLARPEATTVVVDPGLGLLPEPFFSRGVKAVTTAVVTRPDHCIDSIAQGASIGQLLGFSVEIALMFSPALRRGDPWDWDEENDSPDIV